MTLKKQLSNDISKRLGIQIGDTETEDEWLFRMIYSVIARQSFSSLWNISEYRNSVQSFKHDCVVLLNNYQKVYSNKEYLTKIFDYVEEIYDTYERNGFIYTKDMEIVYAMKKSIRIDDIELVKSPRPNEIYCMSGIGSYKKLNEYANSSERFSDVFLFPEHILNDIYDYAANNCEFKLVKEVSKNYEYLNIDSFLDKEWVEHPFVLNYVSVLRKSDNGDYQYYLYKYTGSQLLISGSPFFILQKENIRALEFAILKENRQLPIIRYLTNGCIVRIILPTLLPYKEQCFLDLYSWPGLDGNRLNRIMKADIFRIYKKEMETVGYVFEEV